MKLVLPRFFAQIARVQTYGALAAFTATFLLTSLISIHPAMAQATMSLGDMFCDASVNIVQYIDVFNMFAYVAGIIFLIQAVLHYRHHHENPQQYPHHKGAMLAASGSFLVALPSVVSVLISTFFKDGGGLPDSCTVTEASTSTGTTGVGLDTLLTNFVTNIKDPLTYLMSVVAVLLGIFLIVRGLVKASRYGVDPRAHSMSNIVTNLLIGTILVVTGQSVDMIMSSIFGSGATSANMQTFSSLSWTGLSGMGDTTNFQNAMKAALTFFQLVGLISFVRGWNIIRHAVEGSGQATVPQGITHIIGGVMAINIYGFMKVMDTTFGTGFIS